jgi:hypothetical protein
MHAHTYTHIHAHTHTYLGSLYSSNYENSRNYLTFWTLIRVYFTLNPLI